MPVAAMVQAWQEAARDLGIIVTAPYELDGIECEALVEHFGSPAGTIVASTGSARASQIKGLARQRGLHYSFLNADRYSDYDRSQFISMLDDWGWRGEAQAPSWYSGEPWTT